MNWKRILVVSLLVSLVLTVVSSGYLYHLAHCEWGKSERLSFKESGPYYLVWRCRIDPIDKAMCERFDMALLEMMPQSPARMDQPYKWKWLALVTKDELVEAGLKPEHESPITYHMYRDYPRGINAD